MLSAAHEDPAYRLLAQHASGFMVSQVVFAATELGVFDLLAEAPGPLDAAAISAELGTSAHGTELLLDACVCLQLLESEGHGGRVLYRSTELARTYLARAGPKSQRNLLLYSAGTLYRFWGRLAQAVREGRNQHLEAFGVPAQPLFAAIYRSEAEQLRFMAALQEAWGVAGPGALSAFDLSRFPRICDLGGGSGALARLCAALYPQCRVRVFDAPAVVRMAAKRFPAPRGAAQVDFQEGDFFRDPLPDADLFILARVLHDWADDACARLLRRVHRACPPGGAVLLLEAVLAEAEAGPGPLPALLLSLLLLLQTEGRARSASGLRRLVAAAGFREPELRGTGSVYTALLARK